MDNISISSAQPASPKSVIAPAKPAEPLIRSIQRAVAEHFGITLADMLSDRRARHIARPRQIAIWIARHASPLSLPAIGRLFHRDHTTVMHAIDRVDTLMAAYPPFGAEALGLLLPFLPVEGTSA